MGQRRDLVHRCRLAGEVHGKHRADPQTARIPDGSGHVVRAHQSRVGIDIGEQHLGTCQADGVGGGEEGDRGHDRGVARTEPDAHGGEVERRRAAGTGHRVRRIHGLGKGALKRHHGRAGGQKIAAQHRLDCGNVVVFDTVPAVGEEARHAVSISRRMCSGSSHSSLVSLA